MSIFEYDEEEHMRYVASMIDIHTHILPGVDDGARNLQEAMELLREAVRMGTREIILTPHCAPAYGFWNFDGEELDITFRRLRRAVEQEGLEVRLHPGMEVLYEGREEMLYHREEYCTLCRSRYLLMEYYFDVEKKEFLEGIETALECGFVPVVAHPERYEAIQREPELVKQGRSIGALFQINKSSLKGSHGEGAWKIGHWILEQEMEDFIASDAHDSVRRGSSLQGVEEYVRRRYGKERARRIFRENPQAVIENKVLQRRGEL